MSQPMWVTPSERRELRNGSRLPPPEEDAAWNPVTGGPAVEAFERGLAPQPLEVLSLDKLCTDYPRLREPVVEGVCRRGETINLNADPKIGKSWLAKMLAISIGKGIHWLDIFPTRQGRVLYVDNELHRETLSSRFRTVAEAMGYFPGNLADVIDVLPLRGRLKSLGELALDLLSYEPGKYAAVIYDARYRLFADDENGNTPTTSFYNLADNIGAHLDAAQFFIHHSSRGSQADKKVSDVGAGAGSQSRAADAHLVLRPHEDEGVFILDGVVRSFPPLQPVAIEWRFPVWSPVEGIDTGKLQGRLPANEQRQAERDRETQNKIFAALRSGGSATARQLRERTGLSRERLQRRLDALSAEGHLTVEKFTHRGNECNTYQLPSGDVGG